MYGVIMHGTHIAMYVTFTVIPYYGHGVMKYVNLVSEEHDQIKDMLYTSQPLLN